MKIITRAEFLKMPKNTLYANYEPCWFGPISIKGETIGNDFLVQQIADSIVANDSEEFADKLEEAKNTGKSVEMDFDIEGRDGMFEDNQLFAIYERRDIDYLINRLERCLD